MSRHLKSIVEKNNHFALTQVVFLDIESYSQRRTTNQVGIIDEFTNCLQKTLKEVGQEFIDFMQKKDLNFRDDIILIPTGDGAAVCFTFEGLHDIHVKFAESFLKNENQHNQSSPRCEKFEANGWCNCHNKFNVRIGIDEGKAIIYKDINDNYK
jgi:hypothetical protein